MLMCCPFLQAQETANWQERVIEYVESRFSEDSQPDIEQLLEELQFIANRPIFINTAGTDELNRLQLLNPLQIQNLIRYRETYGNLLSIYEFKAVDGFDEQLIEVLRPFFIFDEAAFDTIRYRPRQELMVRAIQLIEKQKGFMKPSKYEGSRLKLYSRYRFSSKKIQAGFTTEKDAGESFLKRSNPEGFDFYSGFATISQNNKQFYFGDYRLQFGQGLTAWQGFSLGKSVDINAGAKFNQGISPYTSTDENRFMRGIAAQLKSGKFTFYPFYSSKRFDANTDSINGEIAFTSFQTSGLHRTNSEIEDKNSVKEKSTGAYLVYTGKFYSIGISGIHTRYDHPLRRRDADYNRYLFHGKEINNLGIDYKIGINKYFLFGELATCSTKGQALISGILAHPTDKIECSIIYREIGKRYNTPFGDAFTEGSKLNDEQGIYFGLKAYPFPKFSLQAYVDQFKHRWIKYTSIDPILGYEYQIQINYQLTRNWDIYSRYFYENKPVKATVDSQKLNLNQKRQKLRLHVNGDLTPSLFVRTRIELMFYSHDHLSNGIMLFQDLGFKLPRYESNYWIRVAYFNTDDYDSRIYAYENDLLYQFSIPSLYGEGIRSYINGKVKICENLNLWLKASRTWFFGTDGIGSGYSFINKNTKTEFKLQLRFRF